MLKLLVKNIYNRKLNKNEKLQIAFDKKNNVERIFGSGGDDIYFDLKSGNYEKIGTLFLNYLCDNISELYLELMGDISSDKCLEEIEEKYINSYTFYFRDFFKKINIKEIRGNKEEIKSVQEELNDRVYEEIESIEKAKTVEDLINAFEKGYKKLIRGEKISNHSNLKAVQKYKPISKNNPIKVIIKSFLEKAFLKQVYVLLIEYCYFKQKTINCKKEEKKITTRYLLFRESYEKIINDKNIDFIPSFSLRLELPPAIATISPAGEINYNYLIDETRLIEIDRQEKKDYTELTYTNTFFIISLLELLESKKEISKCENCGRYFVLKKRRHYIL